VALFTFLRTDTLARTLECLRENGVRHIIAFSDGPRCPEEEERVARVRALLRGIDWADVRVVERPRNLGLGVSIRTGVAEVLAEHDSVIVVEDDLEFIPGTYDFLRDALARYRDEPRVMSVTAWTHPRTTPAGVDGPYFDGRTECLVWGTWRRAWKGMDRDALSHMQEAVSRGIDPARYGDDLVEMATREKTKNIWAVRWSFLHIAQGGLCLRPPHPLVTHMGLDAHASNAGEDTRWLNERLGPLPARPIRWPAPVEHPDCPRLWQAACNAPRSRIRRLLDWIAGRPRA
jgi:GT2 family glycosyltransferase